MPALPDVAAWEVIGIIAGLLLAGYFSGAETALTSLSEARAKQMIAERGRTAKWLARWLERPQQVLTANLIGAHAASVGVAVGSAQLVERVFGRVAFELVVGIAIVVVLVVFELTPRSIAKHRAAALVPFFLPGVMAAYFLTYPLVALLSRYSRLVTRILGGEPTRSGPFVTEDDIVQMIKLGRKEGVLDKVEGRMLTSIFELGDTLVREVMVPRTEISALPMTAGYDEVMHEVTVQGHSRVPVYDQNLDDVKGFFHTRDLITVIAEKKPFALREHLRPVLFVPEAMRTSDLLKLFQKKKTHLAVVVDEYGGTAGIVALEDVLEEIVGPIHDEHDVEEQPFRKVDENHFLAEGKTGLYELGEALGVQFPADGAFETLGGFLIARCGRMPRKGDRVVWSGWVFSVRDADEKRVARIDVERHQPAGSTPSTPPRPADSPAPEPAIAEASTLMTTGETTGPIDSGPNPKATVAGAITDDAPGTKPARARRKPRATKLS